MWEMFNERPKLPVETYGALRRYILRDRQRKKQELELDKVHEQQRKERELKKKKEEEQTLTIEQTKEQITQVELKLASLKQEKHGLFSQLKKVLHQEVEMRNRTQLKEQQQEQMQQYQMSGMVLPPGGAGSVGAHQQGGAQQFLQSHLNNSRTSKYMNVAMHPPMVQGVKRPCSPTSSYSPYSYHPGGGGGGGPSYPPPPSSSSSSVKQEQPYVASEYGAKLIKTEQNLHPGAAHQGYVVGPPGGVPPGNPLGNPQAGIHYSAQQQPSHSQSVVGPPTIVGGKYAPPTPQLPPPPGQSAFSSYPPHFSQQHQTPPGGVSAVQQSEQYQTGVVGGGGYSPRHLPPQRRHQAAAGYNSPHAGVVPIPLQQQLEHASQRLGGGGSFVEDKFKMHPAMMQNQQQPQAPQQQSKGSIMTGSSGKGGLILNTPPRSGSIVTGNPIRPPPSLQPSSYNQPQNNPNLLVNQRHGYLPQPPQPQQRY